MGTNPRSRSRASGLIKTASRLTEWTTSETTQPVCTRRPQGISGYLLGVDAVREFNVLGNTYGAEYGKRAGAQVTIVTTSGTNQWRGFCFRVFAQQRAGHAELLRRGQCARPDTGTTVPAEPVWQGVRQWSYRLGGEVDRWLAMERDL